MAEVEEVTRAAWCDDDDNELPICLPKRTPSPPVQTVPDGHPLQREWTSFLLYPCFKKEDYGAASFYRIDSVATVEDFWRMHSRVPLPSAVFCTMVDSGEGRYPARAKVGGRHLEGFGLFVRGLDPTWEDVVNRRGGHFECVFPPSWELKAIDEAWRLLQMLAIGHTLKFADLLVGLRIVDKSRGAKMVYRAEIWLASRDSVARESILAAVSGPLGELSGEGSPPLTFVWKDH